MPVRIFQLVLLFLLVGLAAPAPGPGRQWRELWPTGVVARVVNGIAAEDLISKFDLLKDLDTHCPGTVEHRAISAFDNAPDKYISHNQMVHDGKDCVAENSLIAQRSPKMLVLPSAIANRKPDKQLPFRVINMLAANPLKPFNDLLRKRKVPYFVGHEGGDRTCSLEIIFPRDTVLFFVQPDETIEVPGMNTSVTRGSQYMIVWEPDHDVPQCLYISRTIPASPTASPSLSPSPATSPSPDTSSQDSKRPIKRPQGPTSAPRPDLSGSPDSSLSGEESSSANGVAAAGLSPGAIAGIAVGATIMAISIGAAAFVSYRIYHGRNVPIIPELLLPGPPR